MKKLFSIAIIAVSLFLTQNFCKATSDPASLVRSKMGTGGEGAIVPVAVAPFGMVQLGPDTYSAGSGYKHIHNELIGFSHIHKSGGGGTDFQDILFFPVSDSEWLNKMQYPAKVSSAFSHDQEHSEPGHYSVKLINSNINAELTATKRCGMHRYTYPSGKLQQLIIDLKHGSTHGTTIFPEEDFDTVKVSHIEIVNDRCVKGYRISNGWASEQHVYFYAEFSKPIKISQLYDKKSLKNNIKQLTSQDIRAVLLFDETDGKPLVVRVGISPVSIDGAMKNLKAEIATWNFDEIRKETHDKWNKVLSAIDIKDADSPQKEVFYSSLYFSLMYPMLYSDVNGKFRSSDSKVYKRNFPYYAGVLGLWDTFRAQLPLITILHPKISNSLIKTFLEHYKHAGQLPIWTLAGVENMGMIGYHSMPVIADAYYKGIRDYDVKSIYNAMKVSANRDTFGYFLRDIRGALNYKKYHYVPCDLENTSVSKTLEYSYDDWCIAQMAQMLGEKDDYSYYMKRAGYYKNMFDNSTKLMRGKMSNGEWRSPFDPYMSNHYRKGDDFCEGTAWQWTFFVPHDPKGLINLFGGEEPFVRRLDSLFTMSSLIRSGDGGHSAPDITGLVGQYAHGNEPGHHTIYLYNYAAQPWKAQKWSNYLLYNLYNTSPDGICGNDDTGQMSAWYVFSSLGFYPVTHGNGVYIIGTPIFKDVTLTHAKGKLHIKAIDVSRENMYIQSLTINGENYTRNYLKHDDLFGGNTTLVFKMGNKPNKAWGSAKNDLPPSMSDEIVNK